MSYEPITRSYVATIEDVRPGERSVVSKINTRAVDRFRTVIEPAGLDLTAFRSNPVVLWEHGKDPARGHVPVARNKWIKVDRAAGTVIAKTIFRDDAYSDELFRAYQDGGLSGWSINALPREAGPPTKEEIRARPDLADCETIYRSTELIEYSATSCPGNPETLTLMVSRGIWVPDEVRPEVIPEPEPIPEPTELERAVAEFKARPRSPAFADMNVELTSIIRAWRAETAADLAAYRDLMRNGRV